MRKIMERQLKIGQVCIKNIEIDLKSRDEIPQLLLGLQTIFCDDYNGPQNLNRWLSYFLNDIFQQEMEVK